MGKQYGFNIACNVIIHVEMLTNSYCAISRVAKSEQQTNLCHLMCMYMAFLPASPSKHKRSDLNPG